MNANVKTAAGSVLALLLLAPALAPAQQKIQIPGRDKPLTERPAQIFAVGAEDGEDWELLSGVRQVAFDASDNLYVLDGNNYRVLVFDPTGKFVRKIGKQGGGPGELMSPFGMVVTTDGFVVVADLGRRAFSLFKPDGAFVKNVTFEEGEMPGLGRGGGALQAHPKNGVVGRVSPLLMFGRGGPSLDASGGPTGERKSPVKWWDLGLSAARRAADGANVPAGTPTTTQLYEFTLPSVTPKVQESGSGGERRVMVMISQPMWQVEIYQGILPTGGLAFVNEKDYRVNVSTPAGAIERVIERPFTARKATEKDKELAMQQRRESMKNNTTGGIRISNVNGRQSFSSGAPGTAQIPSIEDMLRSTTFEETIPVVNGLRTDPQGRIWIARTPADFGPQGPVDILHASGAYVGTLASARLPDAVSRSGRAAFIERDDLGVEHVAVRRLPASWQ